MWTLYKTSQQGNLLGTLWWLKQESHDFSRVECQQDDEIRNFTVAHELGHLFLHMGYLIGKDTWNQQSNSHQFTRFGTNEQEHQANEFATALLMPQKEFKEKIDEYSSGNIVNMAQVANYFHVSISAAINHGRFLGYLQGAMILTWNAGDNLRMSISDISWE